MSDRLYNVHERVLPADLDRAGALLGVIGGPEDPLWPAPAWEPMILDGPPVVGADGGHGSIRYRVTEVEPARRIRFEFHSTPGITGFHEFSVEPVGEGRVRMRHVLDCKLSSVMRIVGPLIIEPMHDAVLEDLLDNAERAVTGTVARPARWSRRVRLLRLFERRTAQQPPDPLRLS